MAATGAAVGLGAIWKFPYMAGDNGGGAFVLVSVLAIVFIGIPVMMGEILLGRLGRANPIATMRKLANNQQLSPKWQVLGWWGALALLLILSFYSVIAGWSIAYIIKAWTGQLQNLTPDAITLLWNNFLNDPIGLLVWHSIFMFMTLWVVARGVQGGIERASRIMMPGLFIVLFILMIYSSIVGDLSAAVHFLLHPDFSKLTPSVLIDALGQAAFSLAIGAGCMLVYGCYVPEQTKIGTTVCVIAFLVIVVSLLSGLAIFPIVFANGLSPEGGPGLMFKVLPIAFSQMPAGAFFGGLFFLMLWFAAWTSSISLAEPLVVILIEHFKLSRVKASILIGTIAWTLGLLAVFSFNVLSDFKLLGQYDFFSVLVDFPTNIILPTGALCFAIFAGWLLSPNTAQQTMHIQQPFMFKAWQFSIRFVAPLGILTVFLLQ